MEILILNGPNLNLLGVRQPEIYGHKTMDEVINDLKETFPEHNIHYYQSNHEGYLIDKLQEVGFTFDGIIMNAGALTHTSIAIADAVKSITTPVVELHISDVYKREEFRKHSYMTDVCPFHIIGQGVAGYKLGIEYFIEKKHSF